jgi:hypothetical protein
MKYRLFLVCLAVLLGPVVRTPQAVQAGGKATGARVDERLFLLYALEDMVLSMPSPQLRSEMLASKVKLTEPQAQQHFITERVRRYVELSGFLAKRRLLFDSLRRYLQKRKNADFQTILKLYVRYERELDLWKDVKEKVSTAIDVVCRTLRLGQMIAAQRALNSALTFGLLSYFGGASGREALVNGWLKGMHTAWEDRPTLTALQEKAVKTMDDDINKALKEFSDKLEKEQKGKPSLIEEAKQLYTTLGLKDGEFAFERASNSGSTTAPSRNPFCMVDDARRLLDKKDVTHDEFVTQANICQKAADIVPTAAIYSYYRAAFLSVGGRLANSAAAKDLGTTGFVDAIKNPPKAGALALKIWQAYLRNERIDTNITDGVIHRFITACGYAGKPGAAYVVIVANCTQQVGRQRQLRPAASSTPTFWYDCARICSLQGNAVLAWHCLQQAVRHGYRDNEAAKIDPDLQNVRVNRLTADHFKRAFP